MERSRRLILALLEYVATSLREGPTSDNTGKLIDTAQRVVDDAPVSTVLEPGMDRHEFRLRRRAAGLTMAQAARVMGVRERTILRWEHGESRIDSFKAARIRAELTPGRGAKIQDMDRLSGDEDEDKASGV